MKITPTIFALLFAMLNPLSATEGIAFFESKIRPVLADKCYSCHSVEAGKSKGGLLLDSKMGWEKGGDSGPALVPGNPKESELILAIAYGGEIPEMPPKERLPDAVVEDFRKWIEMGAPDPRAESTGSLTGPRVVGDDEIEKSKKEFWAYQPLPAVDSTKSVDTFINAKLAEAKVDAVELAKPRDLVRRLYYDLIGLPPTPEEVDQFLAAADKDREKATAALIDELLASPRFGEKWGRHWLDLARYADSNGGDINLTYHNAWRYRDYVINAFNQDKPYDEFVREQLAGDLLPFKNDAERAEHLIASGYLIVGPKMLSERNKEKLHLDIADEQVDSIGRTFLGLTLGCARCHDHKFDAIPTADYYAMAGILRNTRTAEGIRMGNVNVTGWIERELPVDGELAIELAAFEKEKSHTKGEIKKFEAQAKKLKKLVGDVEANSLGIVVDNDKVKTTGDWVTSTYSNKRFGPDYIHDDSKGKGSKTATWEAELPADGEYEVRISYPGQGGRDTRVPVTVFDTEGDTKIIIDQSKQAPIGGIWKSLGRFHFTKSQPAKVVMSNTDTKAYVIADAVQFISIEELENEDESEEITKARADLAAVEKSLNQSKESLKKLNKEGPKPPMAMAAADFPTDQIADLHIRVRGEPKNLGKQVERGFLRIAMTSDAEPAPTDQSGRLELANWIVSPENPLTARVWVNRLWQHLFGNGIVETVDNFGELGDRPSHPDLLGWLATDHVQSGWSTKHTLRRILLSDAYQRAVRPNPENRLLAHQNRRRLPAESIRDSLMSFAGRLNTEPPGSPVSKLGEQAITNSANNGGTAQGVDHAHRAVFLPMVRNDMPPFLETFDMANPDMVTGKRPATTVPAQALLMLNAPVVKDAAEKLRQRIADSDSPLETLYQTVVGRSPSDYERDRATTFITEIADENDVNRDEAMCLMVQSLLASTEFRFLN